MADRFHLCKNLCDVVEDTIRAHRSDLREPTLAADAQEQGGPDTEPRPALPVLPVLPESHTEICKILGLSDKTVRKFRHAATADQAYAGPRQSNRQIERFASYLQERWNHGMHDGAQLHAEIAAQGYRGSTRSVRRHLQPLRAGLTKAQLPLHRPRSAR